MKMRTQHSKRHFSCPLHARPCKTCVLPSFRKTCVLHPAIEPCQHHPCTHGPHTESCFRHHGFLVCCTEAGFLGFNYSKSVSIGTREKSFKLAGDSLYVQSVPWTRPFVSDKLIQTTGMVLSFQIVTRSSQERRIRLLQKIECKG
jgi:hypothetical protein